MLKPNQKISVKWCGKNRKHYESLGYKFTGNGDTIEVNPEQLTKGSHCTVSVICDYCGEEFYKKYYTYSRDYNKVFGDACKNCGRLKQEKVMLDKYGETNPSLIKEFKEKRKATFIKNFGVDNPSKVQEVKDKRLQTFLEKYGESNPMKTREIQEKAKQTCLERYGVEYTTQSEQMKKKTRETCLKKYGIDNTSSVPELAARRRKTAFNNGTISSSEPERKTVILLKEIFGEENCIPQYPTTYYNLDCLLLVNETKIDVEYDGLWLHSRRKDSDKKRDKFHINQGYKILRIKGNKTVPTKNQLQNAVDYLVGTNNNYTEIILDT